MTPAELDALERRLRDLYVQHGTNYVQHAANAIAALRAEIAAKDAEIAQRSHLGPLEELLAKPYKERAERAEADAAALRALLRRWQESFGSYPRSSEIRADTARALGEGR